MTCVPRSPTETAEAHMIRWSRLLHNCRAKHKLLRGDELKFASYFSWCGHVARVTKKWARNVKRVRIFTLKNMEWLRTLKNELGSQYHGRRFRVWRWEQAAAQCVGTEWVKVAQDRMVWRAEDGRDDKVERKQKMADRKGSPTE